MPRWYYEKKELRQTPSILSGLDPELESRYRREGKYVLSLYVILILLKYYNWHTSTLYTKIRTTTTTYFGFGYITVQH